MMSMFKCIENVQPVHMPRLLEPTAGTSLEHALSTTFSMANTFDRTECLIFNGVMILVSPTSKAEDLVQAYFDGFDAWATPMTHIGRIQAHASFLFYMAGLTKLQCYLVNDFTEFLMWTNVSVSYLIAANGLVKHLEKLGGDYN